MKSNFTDIRSFFTLDNPIKTETSGDGLYTSKQRNIDIRCVEINGRDYIGIDGFFKVAINAHLPDEWSQSYDGFIYTDEGWLKSFREGFAKEFPELARIGTINYTEMGMQGDDHVNLEIIATDNDSIRAAKDAFYVLKIPFESIV